MPRWVVLVVAVVLAAAAATAASSALRDTPPGSAHASAPRGTSAPTASAAPSPAPVGNCWVPTAQGSVVLTTAAAQDLTTRAVTALRNDRAPADFAATISRVLQTPPADSLAVARSLLAVPGSQRLACAVTRLDVDPEKMGRNGLTPRAQRLRRAWTDVFGTLPAGGFASGGVSSGHVDNSAHYEGRAIDVFFRPLDNAEQHRLGWVFAQWVVAHAERHHVLSVIYSDHIWTSWASSAGFRDYQHPGGPTSNPILRHLDHVHVAVESGRPYRPR
jgi:hypothetical protein